MILTTYTKLTGYKYLQKVLVKTLNDICDFCDSYSGSDTIDENDSIISKYVLLFLEEIMANGKDIPRSIKRLCSFVKNEISVLDLSQSISHTTSLSGASTSLKVLENSFSRKINEKEDISSKNIQEKIKMTDEKRALENSSFDQKVSLLTEPERVVGTLIFLRFIVPGIGRF